MLLPGHYKILINAFKKFTYQITNNGIELDIKNKKILIAPPYIELLLKGLFYPDIPCSYLV